MRVLVIQLRQLGDIILTMPVIDGIRQVHPHAHISFLSHPMGRKVLPLPDFNSSPLDQWIDYRETASPAYWWSFLRRIRQQKFDLVLDFMSNPRSAFISHFAGAKKTFAFENRRGWAYDVVVPRHDQGRYIVDQKFDLLRAAGIDAQRCLPTMLYGPQDLAPYKEFQAQNPSWQEAPLKIALSPTHRRAPRRWPLESYARLAERLQHDWRAQVMWLWGPGEGDVVATVKEMTKVPTWIAPPTDMRQLTAMLSRMDLFVGNSNGPSHVAVAAGVCSLQLHGPTEGASWCPNTPEHRYVQGSRSAKLESAEMKDIPLEQVWMALQEMKPVIMERHRSAH